MAKTKKTPKHDDEAEDKALIQKMIKKSPCGCSPKGKKPAKKSKK